MIADPPRARHSLRHLWRWLVQGYLRVRVRWPVLLVESAERLPAKGMRFLPALKPSGARGKAALCAVPVVAWCFACSDPGGDRDPGVAVALSDSAGVQIVTSTPPDSAAATFWRLSDTPRVRIGGPDDHTAQLFGIVDALVLANGNIVVVNASGEEILFFSSTGSLIRNVRSIGEGPGEYRRIDAVIGYANSGVVAYDSRLRRLLVYHWNGEYLHDIELRSLSDTRPVAHLADGRFLVTQRRRDRSATAAPGAAIPGVVPVLIYGSDPSRDTTITELPGRRHYVTSIDGQPHELPVPFAPAPVVTASSQHIYIGHGASYTFRVFTHDGSLVRVIRSARPRVEVDRADIEEFARLLTARNPAGFHTEDYLADVPWPESFPAFTAALVDEDDRLWVRDEPEVRRDGPREPWSVFGSDGALMGYVMVPSDVSILQVTSRSVLGLRWRDDVPEVVLLAIE